MNWTKISGSWLITVWIFSILTYPSLAVHILVDADRNLPQTIVPGEQEVQVFRGNQSIGNHFHQIHIEEHFALIGARNYVYNVSLVTFTESRRLTWHSNLIDVQLCMLKQKTAEECQNYIRVILREGKDRHLICGTNAFRPSCRIYSPVQLVSDAKLRMCVQFEKAGCLWSYDDVVGSSYCEELGVARCPYDPVHNSSAVAAGDRLFFATVADVSARDSLIFSSSLRTEQHDSQWLNDPNFVSSYEFGDKVYFFFREMAVEHINCGKAVFSRVARVCSNDRGGERVLRNTWTSFFKARLNCSIPGEFPFYFDEIQSTSELEAGNVFPTLILNDRVPMVYGVFTTPRNSLRGSAICAFRFSDIVATFDGPFKEQRSAFSNWLPVRESDVPNPHPAKSCLNDTSTLSDQTLNFIKWHPLMDRAVPAFGGQPIIVQSSFNYSFTQVAVDWQVYAADHRYYDILFIATDDGRVLKVINRGRGQRMETEVIEILTVFPDGEPIISLKIFRNVSKQMKKLIVLSRDEVRSIPLHRCHLKTTCSACVALKDPYCSWLNNECMNSDLGLQSIETGRHARCPQTEVVSEPAAADGSLATSMLPLQPGCIPCPCAGPSVQEGGQTTASSEAFEVLWNESTQPTPVPSAQLVVTELTSIPEAAFEEVRVSEPCAEKVGGTAAHHSSSSLALAATLSIIISLSAGTVIGYCVGIRRNTTIYRLRNRDASSLSFNCKNEKVQNQYEIDNTSSSHNCTEQCSALGNGKQCNLCAPQNDRRENYVQPVNGVNRLTSVDRQKSGISYL